MSKQEDFHRLDKRLEKRGKLITKLEYQREPKLSNTIFKCLNKVEWQDFIILIEKASWPHGLLKFKHFRVFLYFDCQKQLKTS